MSPNEISAKYLTVSSANPASGIGFSSANVHMLYKRNVHLISFSLSMLTLAFPCFKLILKRVATTWQATNLNTMVSFPPGGRHRSPQHDKWIAFHVFATAISLKVHLICPHCAHFHTARLSARDLEISEGHTRADASLYCSPVILCSTYNSLLN